MTGLTHPFLYPSSSVEFPLSAFSRSRALTASGMRILANYFAPFMVLNSRWYLGVCWVSLVLFQVFFSFLSLPFLMDSFYRIDNNLHQSNECAFPLSY